MKTTLLTALTAALLVACSGTTPPPSGGGEPPPPPDGGTSTGPGAGAGAMCGGFGGFTCAPGLVCQDDPNDSCDPAAGGADCSGVCVPGPPGDGCDKPGRKYMAKTADKCARIRYFCEPGFVAFHDACGCGCEPDSTPPNGQPCRDKVCGADQFCCNPSCGICAPLGGACTQQICD